MERVRLCLGAKGVQYQKVELDLGKKTPWHLDINKGLVPILETPQGDLIYESGVLIDLIEETNKDKGYPLYPSDPFKKAQMKLDHDKYLSPAFPTWYKVFMSQGTNPDEFPPMIEKLTQLEKYVASKATSSPYVSGVEHPMALDF